MKWLTPCIILFYVVLVVCTQAQTIHQITLPTNDMVYDPDTRRLYASVPSSAGSNGNSIARINPVTGQVEQYIFIGSEPNKIAPSEDGQFLYVSLDGANAVRRFDLATQQATLQFGLGSNPYFGPYYAGDLAVLPGQPHAVAVARNIWNISPPNDGIAVYDDGVQRPNALHRTDVECDHLAFADTASTLYSAGATLVRLNVDAQGLSVDKEIGAFGWGCVYGKSDHLFYDLSGYAADAQAGVLRGWYVAGRNYDSLICSILPDKAHGRVYDLDALEFYNQGTTATIVAYDPSTFLPISSFDIPNAVSSYPTPIIPADLCKWGTDGLAFRNNNTIYLVQGLTFPRLASFTLSTNQLSYEGSATGTLTLTRPAPPGGATVTLFGANTGWYHLKFPQTISIPAGATSQTFSFSALPVSTSQEVTLSATYGAQSLSQTMTLLDSVQDRPYPPNAQVINLQASDLVYDSLTDRLYASVPSADLSGLAFGPFTAGHLSNSIVRINPVTGAIEKHFYIGSEPDKLALSDDGQFLYVGLNGADAIARFDLSTSTIGLQYPIDDSGYFGDRYVGQMVVLPGQPHSVAVSRRRYYTSPSFAGLYIYDDGIPRPNAYTEFSGGEVIAPGATASRLYGFDNESSQNEFVRMVLDSNGITVQDTTNALFSGGDMKYDAGRIYSSGGIVLDPEALEILGTFSHLGNTPAVLPDSADGFVYFITYDDSLGMVLKVFDPNTFLPVETLPLTGIFGATSIVRYRPDHLAFCNGTQIVLLDVSPAALQEIKLQSTSILGGTQATGYVKLTNVAPIGNLTVTLTCSDPSLVAVPATVTVPAGQNSVSFSIPTRPVTATKKVTITAGYAGISKHAALTLNP